MNKLLIFSYILISFLALSQSNSQLNFIDHDSTEENEIEESISFFPNPVSDFLNISALSQETDYSILDITKRQVASGMTVGAIELSAIKRGLYILKLNGFTKKFLKL